MAGTCVIATTLLFLLNLVYATLIHMVQAICLAIPRGLLEVVFTSPEYWHLYFPQNRHPYN